MQRFVQLLHLFLVFLVPAKAQENVVIEWENNKAKSLTVTRSILKHYPMNQDSVSFFNVKLKGQSIAVVGSWEMNEAGLHFTPIWTLSPGLVYEIYWKDKLVEKVLIPSRTSDQPMLSVFPSADTLPENLLKIYFVFSKPMQEGSSAKYIRILNEKNDTLKNIFLDLKPELWNADHTMLTIWIDPGRIKRDLLLNKELGKPLESNNKYTLVVLPGWKDVDGMPLIASFTKRFFTAPADRKKPDLKSWSIMEPAVKTKNSLSVSFPEAMDYALVIRGIDVYFKGKRLTGRIDLAEDENKWIFTPDNAWIAGRYRITISPQVEDLAGNNLERLFDNDLHNEESATERRREEFIIDFEIH